MATTLRLPSDLEADARTRCERIGISLNALVCVALDAYLRGERGTGTTSPAESGEPVRAVATLEVAAPVEPARSADVAAGAGDRPAVHLSRKQRRAMQRQR